MNRLSCALLRRVFVVSIVALSARPATAYDVNAAAAAFGADKARFGASPLVLGGWSGTDSSVASYSVERIMDRADWAYVWARHAPGTPAPDVDFSAAMVIAVFAGATLVSVIPTIHLDSVTESDTIAVTTMNYVNDVVSDERKNLYIFIVLRRSTKRVQVFARSYGLLQSPENQTILLKEFAAAPPSGIAK